MSYCKNCGKETENGVEYCSECTAAVTELITETAPVAVNTSAVAVKEESELPVAEKPTADPQADKKKTLPKVSAFSICGILLAAVSLFLLLPAIIITFIITFFGPIIAGVSAVFSIVGLVLSIISVKKNKSDIVGKIGIAINIVAILSAVLTFVGLLLIMLWAITSAILTAIFGLLSTLITSILGLLAPIISPAIITAIISGIVGILIAIINLLIKLFENADILTELLEFLVSLFG